MSPLETLIVGNLYAFLMVFTRIGTALMIFPGFGDVFVPARVRLFFALGISFVMAPAVAPVLPAQPANAVVFAFLLGTEVLVGIFIGTVARILATALDTAGMAISLQSGLANAQIFNPVMGSQGSLVGAFLGSAGIVLLFATNLHHLLILSVFESYQMFSAGTFPATGGMSEVIAKTVNTAFTIGIQFAAPFIIVGLIVYLGFGILGRLMPQIQVFFLALPVQILLSLITLLLVVSVGMLFWLSKFEETYTAFIRASGG